MDIEQIAAGFQQVLDGLGLDQRSHHLRDSPRRTAEAWVEEICAGLREPTPELSAHPVEEGRQQGLVALHHIPVKSLCAHHLLPFTGQAVVAYLPGATFCGLSGLSRVVNHFARRPQMQEALTNEVAAFVDRALSPRGVGVIVEASHYCMEVRGVNHPGVMTTTCTLGALRDDPTLRQEFFALARQG